MSCALGNGRTSVALRPLELWCLLSVDIHPLALDTFLAHVGILVHVHLRLLFFALPLPLGARNLSEDICALLDTTRIESSLRHLCRELGQRAKACCARKHSAVLHGLLRALGGDLLLERVLGQDGLALVLGIVLRCELNNRCR